MSFPNRGYRALLQKSALDRDQLIRDYFAWKDEDVEIASRPVPAAVLDDIIRDVVECKLIYCHLPLDRLGEADFSSEVPTIRVNEDFQEVPGFANANPDGLLNVTKAHELGHVRRDHGKQMSHLRGQMSMFGETAAVISCPRRRDQDNANLTPAERKREFEAWAYAEGYLVFGWPLARCAAYQQLQESARGGRTVSSDRLWRAVYEIAGELQITPAFATVALEHAGMISNQGGVLGLNPQLALLA